MSATDQYQAIVIGTGQGGKPLSVALAAAGWRTAILEREHVGGTCVNVGCTPTKTMVASGRVAYLTRRATDYGVQTANIRIDMPRIRQRKRDIVDSFRNRGQTTLEKTRNLDLIFGEASFTSPNSLTVRLKDGTYRTLGAEKIFIDAGCRPAIPQLDGLKDVPYLNSTSVMELDTVPEHLLVLGGGYVGLEFGQMFRRFGSRVSIVHRGDRLLRGEDSDVADEIAALLRQDGVDIFLNTTAERVTTTGSQVLLTAREKAGTIREIQGSHLLVATSRVPNVEPLNLSAAGIATDSSGFIKVNSKLETSTPGVYALGDINGGPAFTHISYDDFRIPHTNLIAQGSAATDRRLVPYTVYIDPQLGRIGITEAQAREQNKNVRVAKMPMSSVARALEVDESRGFMKAIVDAHADQILGAAVLGIESGEIMSILQLAMWG